MLIRLLRTHLQRYRRPLLAVIGLQLVGTIASLYLPSLNADIIDRGIATGDTGYIMRLGGVMLLVSARADRLLDRRGVLRRPHGHGLRRATCAPRSSTASAGSPRARWASSARRR